MEKNFIGNGVMANTTVRRSISRDRRIGQQKLQPLPLVTRRFAAWTIEVSLIAISGLVPFSIGTYVKSNLAGELVPLNPVLAVTQEAIAITLARPAEQSDVFSKGEVLRRVPPLTNMLWSVALIAPIGVTFWQLYLMAKTGSTLPKRWFGVRVVTASGTVPGIRRVLLREGIGCWGLPLSIAYLLWYFSSGFPSISVLVGLSGLMVFGEGTSARFSRQRRCFHDRLVGTYVVDANRTFRPFAARSSASVSQTLMQPNKSYPPQIDSSTYYANTKLVIPAATKQRRSCWKWMRQHPSVTLLLVSLSSMATVLATLVGTQIYIQTQKNHREFQQYKSEQFIALLKQLNADPTKLDERQKAVLAMGTLDNPQSLQLLVDLLGQESTTELINSIQQALASTGPKALPYLHTLNQSLSNEINSRRYTSTPQELELLEERLLATQKAIANILSIYSGKLNDVDLGRSNLGQTLNDAGAFNLVLDETDLSGIELKAANLNHASLHNSIWQGLGKDGRADTFDDAIANLSDAQMQEVNLTSANLSRVPMNRTDLSRATLSQANLAGASLNGANLSSAQLIGANLRAVALANASLTGADLGEAILDGANLYAARLGRVNALGTSLQSANLTKSDWQGADLSKSDLSRANLRNADFSSTKLTGANFSNAQLQNATLRDADLKQADLRGANLTGTDFQGASLFTSKPNQPNPFIETLSEASRSTIVEGVDFAKAKNLDAKQLAYICNQGGLHPRCPK